MLHERSQSQKATESVIPLARKVLNIQIHRQTDQGCQGCGGAAGVCGASLWGTEMFCL